jgi:hypothetical protein
MRKQKLWLRKREDYIVILDVLHEYLDVRLVEDEVV